MNFLQFITVSVFVFLPEALHGVITDAPMDVRKYFTELDNDMTKVTWVHRCNSRDMLEKALSHDEMMIEADIVAGHLQGDSGGPPIPVMGHPPDTIGDISLEQFLDTVLRKRAGKGIKLDFKSLEIFKASENVLEQFLAKAEVDFPVWVNADVLKGPGHPPGKDVVEHSYFLHTCVKKFPTATISVGWSVDPKQAETLKYTSKHIDEMTSILADGNVVHPVTFPVHSGIAANSIDTLTKLIHTSVDGTSLTLWAGSGEWVDYDKLRQLITSVGKDKVFVDMPKDMLEKLNAPQQSKAARITAFGVSACILLGFILTL